MRVSVRYMAGWMRIYSGWPGGRYKLSTGTEPTSSVAAVEIRTKLHPTERAKECPQCGRLHFPRLAPAIIVLVERGHEMLLARARRFPTVMYSTLAGFVEPGETLEEAVVREVKEESGITVKDIRYFGSQPWPFPHSLMIGFTAVYESGEITLGDEENIDAGWFSADNLPPLPGKISIARKLIDWFLEKQGKLPGGDHHVRSGW